MAIRVADAERHGEQGDQSDTLSAFKGRANIDNMD